MALPYSTATSGRRALEETEKILTRFGCSKFASGTDYESGEVFVQFEHHGRPVTFKASAKGYAAAWLRQNPWNSRKRSTKIKHEQEAIRIGSVAVYSILRDAIKGQVAAIETGIWTFEEAFLSHIMLSNGRRIIDEIHSQRLLPEAKISKEPIE